MTRWLVFSVLLISLPTLTDWLVDRQFRAEPVGYTQQQRNAMDRLVARSLKPAYTWRTHRAAVTAAVWGITPQELDRPVSIFGEGNRR